MEHSVPSNNTFRLNFGGLLRGVAVPLLAIFTAVLIGSVFILLAGLDPLRAFSGLLTGSLGTDANITRTLIKMTPLILSGLAVAFAFKGGLFNIGAQGQLVMGSMGAAWVGFAPNAGVQIFFGLVIAIVGASLINRLPRQLALISAVIGGVAHGALQWWFSINAPLLELAPVVHILLAVMAGMLSGAAWGFIPGFLKARTGAHEVISTIMLNYIAALLLEWLVAPGRPDTPPGPLAFCRVQGQCASNPNRTPPIFESAYLPTIYQPGGQAPDALHLGVLIAVFAALFIFFVLYRTTFGFELRMVGLNPNAARYSGIKVARMTIITMMIAGGLAGLAGAIQVLGVTKEFQTNQNLAVGFDSIAVSLLAANNPIGIIPSAFLFGVLDSGSAQMQLNSRVPSELIQVVQALILMFVAADQIIRGLYRIKGSSGEKFKISTAWGQR